MSIFSRLFGKKKDKDSDKTIVASNIEISKEGQKPQSNESSPESDNAQAYQPECIKTKSQVLKSTDDWNVKDKIDNRYEIYEIKHGGMGYVYICYDQRHYNIVAIKTLNDELFENDKFTLKFYQEAQTWVDLDKHKNIVQAKYAFKVNDRPYIVLENVVGDKEKGPDLKDWIKSGELDLKTSLSFTTVREKL